MKLQTNSYESIKPTKKKYTPTRKENLTKLMKPKSRKLAIATTKNWESAEKGKLTNKRRKIKENP